MLVGRPPLVTTPCMRAATPTMSSAVALFADPASDPIAAAFEFVTLVPQPIWLLMVLLPSAAITRKIMEPIAPLAVLGLAHLLIGCALYSREHWCRHCTLELFNKLFDANEDGLSTYLELGTFRNFAAEEWTHVLIWDLFVGRYIWLDGRRRDIFTSHSVLLTNLIGPPGLLCHLLTCLVLGKGVPQDLEATE